MVFTSKLKNVFSFGDFKISFPSKNFIQEKFQPLVFDKGALRVCLFVYTLTAVDRGYYSVW